MEMPKLAICIPLYRTIPVNFFVNFINRLMELLTSLDGWEIDVIMETGTVLDRARNRLVEKALQREADYIWFIDSDCIIPKGAFEKLLKLNAEIASGVYFVKVRPYVPVMRKEIEGRLYFMELIDFNRVYEVDGIGMGCCLIKADVFKKLPKPWFKFDWTEDGRELSEDLYFCRLARKHGFKILVDTSVIVGHQGGTVTDFEYRAAKPRIKLTHDDREECIRDAMEFYKMSYTEIRNLIDKASKLYAEEFKKFFRNRRKTSENLTEFYKTNKYGILDLIAWHFSTRRAFDLNLVDYIKREFPDKSTEILDYGCGIGQNAYMLAREGYQVTAADFADSNFLKFLKFRCRKHGIKMKFLPLPLSKHFRGKFDLILCFDVLEHIPDSEFENTIKLLKRLKKPNGKILVTASFGDTKSHPMHFKLTKEKKRLIETLIE